MIRKMREWFRGDVIEVYEVDFDSDSIKRSPGRIRVEFIFAWYDFWFGVFVDTEKRRVYVFPVPMLGFKIYWGA